MRPNGLPELYAAPLSHLAGDVPLRPRLLGNLVPHQLNLWMGASQNGTPLLASSMPMDSRVHRSGTCQSGTVGFRRLAAVSSRAQLHKAVYELLVSACDEVRVRTRAGTCLR